ncbi:MAG: hypothetical protein Q4B68_09640, partial [Bacteroidales bacterium]|nr:hypothetical protein [Bacteroidales bacterium]
MKKIFLMMAAMAMTAGMIACSGKTESSAAASAEEVSVEEAAADANANAVIYKNEKFGFSVQLPEGFEPQNDDKQMEEERGGKLYIWQGCMVDMQGADISAKVAIVKEQLEIDAAI